MSYKLRLLLSKTLAVGRVVLGLNIDVVVHTLFSFFRGIFFKTFVGGWISILVSILLGWLTFYVCTLTPSLLNDDGMKRTAQEIVWLHQNGVNRVVVSFLFREKTSHGTQIHKRNGERTEE
jgi:hypothetical protein